MIFLGCLFDRTQEKELKIMTRCGMSNAANTFQWDLIDGFNQHMGSPISIYNVLPVGTYPWQFQKLILPTKEWSYHGSRNMELGCINLPFIKQFMRFCKAKKLLKQTKDREIIIYSTYLPFLQAVQHLDSSYHVTLVVTDLPEFYDLGKTSHLKKWLRIKNNYKIVSCLKRIDSFVLLTEQMKEPLAVGDRPYVVVEGICGSGGTALPPLHLSDKKVILYTGTLYYQFGIRTLLQAFSQIDVPNYELWICGTGEAESEIVDLLKKNSRIKFFGFITKDNIYKLQKQATILVNPRTNDGDYTKYSFPSKTIEYMASGKPILMYKLDGIPSEYNDYLYFVSGNTVQNLKESIVNTCEKNNEELESFGLRAKEFVLKNKNAKIQAKKIIDMIVKYE